MRSLVADLKTKQSTIQETLTFDNGTGFNDYFDDFTFGTTISFDASLHGPALSAPDGVSTSGSTFVFSMFSDAAGTIPVLTSDTTHGFAFTVNVNLDGTTKVGAKGVYTYDFGDGWEHNIVVEKVLTPEPGVEYPVCIAGKRRGPPEDSGGPFGYENLLEALGNPKHEEHKAMREWIGEGFEPEVFSVDDVNRRLALLRRRAKTPKSER